MKTAYRKFLSTKLTSLRKEQNLSRVEVAAILGIPASSYKHYEFGKAEPSMINLYKLCKLYKISVDKFLDDVFLAKNANF